MPAIDNIDVAATEGAGTGKNNRHNELQASTKEQRRLERAARKIILRMRNAAAGIAFSTWLERAEECRRLSREQALQSAMKALEDEKSDLVQKMQVHKTKNLSIYWLTLLPPGQISCY